MQNAYTILYYHMYSTQTKRNILSLLVQKPESQANETYVYEITNKNLDRFKIITKTISIKISSLEHNLKTGNKMNN